MPRPQKPADHDFSVMIPYSRLCELMQAASEIEDYRKDCVRLQTQFDALRLQFLELMETFRLYQD